MKKSIVITIVFLSTLLFTQSHKAGELQFLWSKYLDSGVVFDMEFMPDNNYFIMGTYYYTQIRETATGNLIKTYPFYLGHIEFTPDSTKMITQHEYNIQLRNINDLSVIKQYTLPWGTDTTDLNYEISSIGWSKLLADPIRPLCYALRVRAGYISNNVYVNFQKIIIYNYETMEEVGKLTSPGEETAWYTDIAISKDGKYLAAINEGTSYLKVWDLNTRQKIRDFKISKYPYMKGSDDSPQQILFSKINSDDIYLSGSFSIINQYVENVLLYHGLLKYNIQLDKIVDSTFATGPLKVWDGPLCFFDNEERSLGYLYNKFLILNWKEKQIEQVIQRDTIKTGEFWYFDRYSESNKFFIGGSRYGFSGVKYDINSFVPIPQSKGIVFPNPATDYIEIFVGAGSELSSTEDIRIYNILGIEVSTPPTSLLPLSLLGEGEIRLDVSSLAPGVYFVRVGDVFRKFVKG